MEIKKPEVGQKLYSLNVGNAARSCEQKLTPVIVTKVGRKYFSVKREDDNRGWTEIQFHLDGWHEKSEYMASSSLYLHPQEWEDQKEKFALMDGLKDTFGTFGRKDIPLPVLRTITGILDAN